MPVQVAELAEHRQREQPEGELSGRLAAAFAGVSNEEVAQMVGGNAARVYGFDPERLAPLVARIGPEPGELSGGTG